MIARLVLAGTAVALVWARRRLVAVTVVGESMEPALRSGDRVLVRRTTPARLRLGDVVVVTASPGPAGPPGRTRWMVKRIAALPGHGVPQAVVGTVRMSRVPSGRLVLLGDNAALSVDSRLAGFYGTERVLGRVVRRLG